MDELIKIEESEGKQTVNARDLHEFLQSKQDFSTWIKARIEKYDFAEGVDFVKIHKKMELSQTGQNGIEYHISLDMAKEISMVENNEMGKAARKYFIEAESKYKVVLTELEKSKMSAQIYLDIMRPNETARLMLIGNICKKHHLPMDMIPDYAHAKVTFSMTALVKKFGVGMSVQTINRKLIEKGILREVTRKSRTKGEKKYLSITESGSEYGENLQSPQNPLETQPHWYEEKFPDLLKMIA
ncbi:MAG TPA: antA/AntB antirepressor family protein [Candidatus Omnitrophota bacterium]|nr:antA/AntB antirepressor family protein [Candidatus Omnitrophota bacterium]